MSVTDATPAEELHQLLQLNLLLAAVFVLLTVWNGRYGSPLLTVVGRWLRWVVVAIAAGTLMHVMAWVERPLPVLIAMAAVGFGLVETVRNWILTGLMSRSELPLFPRFRATGRGDEWPTDRRILRLRSWLRTNGFAFVEGIHTDLSDEIRIRGSVYLDAAGHTRLHILFLPQPGGRWIPTLSFQSRLADGTRILTDNSVIPFGGFFPAGCEIRRMPLTRSPDRLMRMHRERVGRHGGNTQALSGDPVGELNAFQSELEEVNVRSGFLQPRALREEEGRLTKDGRYRLWREIWMMEYLGIASRSVAFDD